MSGYEEERKAYSKSPLDDLSREVRLISYARPLTAKKIDFENHRGQKKYFSRLNSGVKAKKNSLRDKNTLLIGKLKPNKISMDKERLYIENMQLKVKNNDLNELLVKYKAKIVQLEKEKNKKEESPTPSHSNTNYYVKLLKQNIKELKFELHNKENEINKQKKSMKITKVFELELEIKAYVDECTRLKHYLEEILKEKDDELEIPLLEANSDTKTSNLLKIIEENQKEIQNLKEKLKSDLIKQEKIPKIKEEINKFGKEIEQIKQEFETKEKKLVKDLEKLKKDLKEEQNRSATSNFKLQEANLLIETLYKELKSLRKKNSSRFVPPKILKIVHEIAQSLNQSVEEYLLGLAGDSSKKISTSQFLSSLKQFDTKVTNNDLEGIIMYIKGQNASEISIQNFINYYNTYDFIDKQVKEINSIGELLQHLALRMQLHRVPKTNLIEALIGAGSPNITSLHSQEITLLFTNSPFNFTRKEANMITNFLFQEKKAMQYSDFMDNFYKAVDEWEIFTPKDEESFDSFLLGLVGTNSEKIEKFCAEFDAEDKGVVSVDVFLDCLKKFNILLPERVFCYLTVLFYSHNMELNTVPYRQFLQAYANTDESSFPDDFKKNNRTQEYLEMISSSLIGKSKSVRDVFKSDSNGNILAEDFIAGINKLEMEEIPKDDLVVLLEALQNNQEERVICIFIQDLEDIMESFGVPKSDDTFEVESGVGSLGGETQGHVQKISLLDTAQLEEEFHDEDFKETGNSTENSIHQKIFSKNKIQ